MDNINNGAIYMIENIVNTKKYIGLTTVENPRERFIAHMEIARGKEEDKYYFHRAISKYGESKFRFRVLEDGFTSFQKLCEREVFYIELLGTFGERGYNLTVGGEGTLGHKSSKHLNKPVLKIDIITGEILEEYESTVKAGKSNGVGSSAVADAARKFDGVSAGCAWVYREDYGNFVFDRHRYLRHNRVFQLDKYTGEVVEKFKDTTGVADKLGCSTGHVSQIIKDEKVFQGFVFIREGVYKDPNYRFNMMRYLDKKAVAKLDKDTNELLGVYYNAKEATEDTGLACHSGISHVLSGKHKTAGGYKWLRCNNEMYSLV